MSKVQIPQALTVITVLAGTALATICGFAGWPYGILFCCGVVITSGVVIFCESPVTGQKEAVQVTHVYHVQRADKDELLIVRAADVYSDDNNPNTFIFEDPDGETVGIFTQVTAIRRSYSEQP
jgi:hypothetical protein